MKAPQYVFARLTDPTTSWDAAASIDNAVTLSQLQSLIISLMGIMQPLTDEQLHEGVDVLWAELKRQKGKLTARQEEVISLLIRGGHEVHVWRPSDWPKVEARLK